MGKIFKNFVPHIWTVLLIILLLVVQASCDLALPQYTSDIIDTGIQNKGVEHILPEKMTAKEYDYALMFMADSENKLFTSAYKSTGKLYSRTVNDKKALQKFDDELLMPIMTDYSMATLSVDRLVELVKQNVNKTLKDITLSTITLDQIEEYFGIKLPTFENKSTDENGDPVTEECVDARPLIKLLTDGVDIDINTGVPILPKLKTTIKLDQKTLLQTRKFFDSSLKALGSDTLKNSAIAFAVKCDEEAGVDINKIQTDYLWFSGIKMLIVSFILSAAAILAGLFAAIVGSKIGKELRSNVFRNVIGFSNAEIDKFSTASLITRTTNDIQQVQMVSVLLLRMVLYAPIIGIGGVIKVIGTGASMWWVIALAVGTIMTLVFTLTAIAMPKFKLMQKLIDRINLIAREILTGIPVIRAFGREKTEEERFDEANVELTKTMLFTNRVMTFMMPMMMILMNFVSVLIVWVASGHISDGNMQVGEMTAFITYSMQIIISFLMLTMMSIFLPRAAVAAGRIDEVVKTESSVTDRENAEDLSGNIPTVEFKNVNFRYPGANEDVLSSISFTAKPGETTAIIGSTGSGKSTLVNLILRLYDVTDGEIDIYGKDIRDVTLSSLREQIGYVPQKGILFSGTINSNLKFGNQNASDEEIQEASEIAKASEFIESKHDRFDSAISQGGTNVSGGQKQRLSIARAIVKNPNIYIFDDSFSALDMKTDKELRQALSEKTKDKTVIIVAQRISTILKAEQIIVLDEGKIAGIGTHSQLLENCPAYLEIAKSQLSEKELGIDKEVE